MKIYVTGDVHGLDCLERLIEFNSRHKELSKKDYVIVLGDLLGTGEEYKKIIDTINKLNFTVLFIDGDCENYDYLSSLEEREFNLGKANYLSDNLIHLKRGEIYLFDKIKIFTFGGADFLTKNYDMENGNIPYKERIPSLNDVKYALSNLEKNNGTVDFILTHESPSSAFIYTEDVKVSFTTKLLDKIEEKVKYKWWYFGHYHHDISLKNNKTIVYEKFIRIN